ncbi:A2 protein, related, partial [Plasmodium ovale curtisi]
MPFLSPLSGRKSEFQSHFGYFVFLCNMFYLYNKFKSSSTKGHDERSENRDGETNICTTSDDNTKEKKYIDGFRKEEDDDLFLLLEESTHNRENNFRETQSCEAGNKGMCDREEVDVKGVNPEYVTSDLNKQDESWMQFDVKWDEVDSYPIKMLNTNVSQEGVHYKQFDDSGDDFFKIDQENFSTFTFSTCDDTKRKSKIECSENVGQEGERNPRTGEENSERKKNGDYIDITCTVDTKNGLFENRNGEIKNLQFEGRNCEIATSLWQTEEPTQLEITRKNDNRKEKHKNESTLFFRKEEGISKKDEHEHTLFEEEISFFSLNESVEHMEVRDEINRKEKSKECLLSSGSENKKECLLSSWPEESKECPFSSGPEKNISHERTYRIINPPAGMYNCGDTHAERIDDSFNFDFEDTDSEENIKEDCQEVQKSNCQRGDVHNEECVNRKHVPWYDLKKSLSSANGGKEGEAKKTENSSRSDLERDRSELEGVRSELEKDRSELERDRSELEKDRSELEESACEHKQIELSEPEVGHESRKEVFEKRVLENKYMCEEWKSISKKHKEPNCEDNLFVKEDMEDDKQKKVFYSFHLEDEGVCRVGVENTEEEGFLFKNKEVFDMLEAVGKGDQDTFCESKEKFDIEDVAEKIEGDVILEKKEAYEMGKDGNKNEEKDFIFYMERGHTMEKVEQTNEKGDLFLEKKETFDIESIEEDREDYVECDSFEKLQLNVDGDNFKLENVSEKDHVDSVDIYEHVLREKREGTREVEEEGAGEADAEKEGEERVNKNLEKKKNERGCEDDLVRAKETNETEIDNPFGNAQVEHEKETSKWKKENVVLTLSHDGSKKDLLSFADLNNRYLHIGDNRANGCSNTLKEELNDVICSLSHEQYLRGVNYNWTKEKFEFCPNMSLTEENEIRFNDGSGNELWDEEESGKDACGKEENGKEENGKEENGKEEIGKEEIGKEEIGKEEIGKEEIGKEKIGKEESSKEEIGKEEIGKEEIGKEEIGKEEIGKEEIGKEKIGKEESSKEEIGKEEIGK